MPDSDLIPTFGQMMRRDWAEALSRTQAETHYRDSEGEYPRVPFGRERSLHPSVAASGPCRHCDCEFIGHEWRDHPA